MTARFTPPIVNTSIEVSLQMGVADADPVLVHPGTDATFVPRLVVLFYSFNPVRSRWSWRAVVSGRNLVGGQLRRAQSSRTFSGRDPHTPQWVRDRAEAMTPPVLPALVTFEQEVSL